MPDSQPDKRQHGKLFIVSAPSGAGKTTLCNALRNRFPEMAYSVSCTTRSPRENETHGQDYFFISTERFEEKIEKGEWAEWARVHDNYYGTCAETLNHYLNSGKHILLDIDIAGARQIKTRYPDSITFFIMPPSMAALEKRLRSRGTNNEQDIRRRIEHARKEIASRNFYDHIIVNDRLDDAIDEISELIRQYTESNRVH